MRSLVFFASLLLLVGCSKPSGQALTDWGVVEVKPGIPKHLILDGNDCILTATPLANGSAALNIESQVHAPGTNIGANSLTRMTANMIAPVGVAYSVFVGPKLVRFTLKIGGS